MEKIALIVQKLNGPPFDKRITTMTEFDSKSSLELLDLMCEIVCAIDPEQEEIYKEPTDFRVRRIIQFLVVMKFNIPEEQMEDFQNLLLDGDKEMLQTIMHWCLQRLEHLQKRAYLAKYLMPVEIPAEFFNEDLIAELSQTLKELQGEFKEVHKAADQTRSSGAKPSELKTEIAQLEQEKTQLQNKIQKMKKDMNVDEDYFKEMLKVGYLYHHMIVSLYRMSLICQCHFFYFYFAPQIGNKCLAQGTGARSHDARASPRAP